MFVFKGAPAPLRLIPLLALAAVPLLSGACGGSSFEPAVSPTSTLSATATDSGAGAGTTEGESARAVVPESAGLGELRGIEDLRVLFNHAEGLPRVLLLVSPT